jgi:ornithine lipid ester-linked acyl 2-hydroxylase
LSLFDMTERSLTSLIRSLRKRRRRTVKRTGRKLINGLADLVARQSLVDDQPIYDSSTFPFLKRIEECAPAIRTELQSVLEDRHSLPPFHKISPDQKYISVGTDWKVFFLYGFGVPSNRNCARCPRTAALLETVPGLQSAWFSILAPRYHIPRHRGITKTVLRAHLGLVVPADAQRCLMEVGDARVSWEAGKSFVFDDFYPHEVWNDTDEERIILIFDFDRPMRLPGRVVNKALMWGIKRTAYYKDAERNLKDWDQKLETAAAKADAMFDDVLPPD